MTGTVRISMPQRILLSPRTRGRRRRSHSAQAIRPYWTEAQRSTAQMSKLVLRSGTFASRRTDTRETVANIVVIRAVPAMRRATVRLCRPSWYEEKRTLGWTRRNKPDTSRPRARRRLPPPLQLLPERTCAGLSVSDDQRIQLHRRYLDHLLAKPRLLASRDRPGGVGLPFGANNPRAPVRVVCRRTRPQVVDDRWRSAHRRLDRLDVCRGLA